MNNREFGRRGERDAARFLKRNGYKIVGRNVYVGRVEIDIIARDSEHFLFVEVKTRHQVPGESLYGRPADALTPAKRHNMLEAATRYISENPDVIGELSPRIDAVEVYVDPNKKRHRVLDIRHFKNVVHPRRKI